MTTAERVQEALRALALAQTHLMYTEVVSVEHLVGNALDGITSAKGYLNEAARRLQEGSL